MVTRPKKNPQEQKEPDPKQYLVNYKDRVKRRHPDLFESQEIVSVQFCKKFLGAETKGKAKRILKEHLIKIN